MLCSMFILVSLWSQTYIQVYVRMFTHTLTYAHIVFLSTALILCLYMYIQSSNSQISVQNDLGSDISGDDRIGQDVAEL